MRHGLVLDIDDVVHVAGSTTTSYADRTYTYTQTFCVSDIGVRAKERLSSTAPITCMTCLCLYERSDWALEAWRRSEAYLREGARMRARIERIKFEKARRG